MGLFDKLKNVVSVNQSESNPLSDVVVKNYFEIICGMRHTFLASGPEKVNGNEKAKKYVEYFLGNPCDEKKLETTLELYNLSRTDTPNGKLETIVSNFRKSLINEERYCLDRHEAHKMFCQDEIEKAETELNQVIDVIKDNVNYRHFSQGVRKIPYSNSVTDIAIMKSFCDGNPVIQKLILEYLTSIFVGKLESETYNCRYDSRDDIALLVIKALNFEKFKGNPDEYETATEDDCRDFVLNVPYYSRVIDDNPFDKEEYITEFIKDIKSREIFSGTYSTIDDGYYLTCTDDYFCDFACYLMWKSVAGICIWRNADGDDIRKSKIADDVFGIICTYLSNPDKYDKLEPEEYYDDEEETGDVEVYNTISDDVRSRLGDIDLDDE